MERKTQIDELTIQRLKKTTDFGVIALGNGVTNYVHVQCTQCNSSFREFTKLYSNLINEIVPACPSCNADIYTTEFLPLGRNKEVIK